MGTPSWNNHANQLNPNNSRYWNSRGLPGKPENWQDAEKSMIGLSGVFAAMGFLSGFQRILGMPQRYDYQKIKQGEYPKSIWLEGAADIGSIYLFTKTLAPCYAMSKGVIGGLLSVKGLAVIPPIAIGWFLYQRKKASEDPWRS